MGGPLRYQLLFFGVVLAVPVCAALVSSYLAAKRRREVLEQAARMGFAPVADGAWAVSSLGHPLFQRGRDRACENLIEGGADGLRARLFDYRYTTGSGRDRTTRRQTVAAFQLAQSRLPDFQMFPERFYHALAELVGFKDIDFDGFPEFSDNYRLLGGDEAAVRRLFHPGAVSALGAQLGWSVEGAGQTLIVYHPARRVDPDQLPQFLAEARRVAGALSLR